MKGGCLGSSESTLVKIPHCWKSHVVAHSVLFKMLEYYVLQAIKGVITSIPHTRGSIEGPRDISHAGLVSIKNKILSQSSSKLFL